MSVEFVTPSEVAGHIAAALRKKRLTLNLSQQSLAERSAVSLGVLKKFERTGKISLESLLKLALTVGSLRDFMNVFAEKPPEAFATLDELLKDNTRKRGRK